MALSLKQSITSNAAAVSVLETNLSTLKTEVSEAVAFHHNIIHDDENIKVLTDRVTANASNITTLDTTTTAQAAEIDIIETNVANNATSIQNLNSGFTSEIARVDGLIATETTARTAADTTLQTNINTEAATRAAAITNEATARSNADTTLQTNIDAEASARTAADTTLQSNLDTEASARTSADTTLQTNIDSEAATRLANDNTLQTNINSEASSRVSGDNKQCFVSIMEAEGILATDTFPFCSGMGSPSSAEFGFPVPFGSVLVGVSLSISSNTNGAASSVSFIIEHYNTDGSKPTLSQPVNFTLSNISVNRHFNSFGSNLAFPAGNYVIRCSNATSLTDTSTRYRLALYLQSSVELTS